LDPEHLERQDPGRRRDSSVGLRGPFYCID
jgi:hypothetical protein